MQIYTHAPHIAKFLRKKNHISLKILFFISANGAMPIAAFFTTLTEKRNTKYLLYFLHISNRNIYIISIYYTLITNILQAETSDAPNSALKNMPVKR